MFCSFFAIIAQRERENVLRGVQVPDLFLSVTSPAPCQMLANDSPDISLDFCQINGASLQLNANKKGR